MNLECIWKDQVLQGWSSFWWWILIHWTFWQITCPQPWHSCLFMFVSELLWGYYLRIFTKWFKKDASPREENSKSRLVLLKRNFYFKYNMFIGIVFCRSVKFSQTWMTFFCEKHKVAFKNVCNQFDFHCMKKRKKKQKLFHWRESFEQTWGW